MVPVRTTAVVDSVVNNDDASWFVVTAAGVWLKAVGYVYDVEAPKQALA